MGETVAALTALEELMLNGNQLITLPNEIGELQNLEKLDIANNRLQALPRAVGRLTRVCCCGCGGVHETERLMSIIYRLKR
jgi:Leucine-rich repeat (LRR) protein